MLAVTLCFVLVIVYTFVKGYDVFIKKNYDKKGLSGILFFGSLAPLIGIIGQMVGMMAAFHAIQNAGDISPNLVAGGLKVSMYAPLYGLIILFFSALLWFILKSIIEKKQG